MTSVFLTPSLYSFLNPRCFLCSMSCLFPFPFPFLSSPGKSFVIGNTALSHWPIIYCNEAFVSLFGWTRSEIMGLPVTCSFLFGPETNEQMVDDFETGIREREEYECEVVLYPKHGLCLVMFFLLPFFFIPFLYLLSAHFISRCLCHCLSFCSHNIIHKINVQAPGNQRQASLLCLLVSLSCPKHDDGKQILCRYHTQLPLILEKKKRGNHIVNHTDKERDRTL